MLENKEKKYVAEDAYVTQEAMLDGIEYQELIYLPENHSLAKR